MFGLLTPITDGLKLFLKFALFVVSVDIVYLIGAMFITAIWFIILLDNCFTLFILLLVHTTSNLFSVFFIGCFLFTSCFVYLAAMRTMLFSIVGESSIFLLFLTSYLLDYFSYLGIKDICVGQLYINNSYIGDGLKLPFDYFECESELVAGLVTEFSGIFFVIYSIKNNYCSNIYYFFFYFHMYFLILLIIIFQTYFMHILISLFFGSSSPPLPSSFSPQLSLAPPLMFIYICHVFLFLCIYGFIILCDYTSLLYLSFDLL
eukprot:gene12704-8666_t